MDVSLAARPDERRLFLLRVVDAPDALARLLTPFAVAQAALAFVEYRPHGREAGVRIEARGLDAGQAETIRRRLAGSPQVLEAAVGWCGEPSAS